ncbi:MAG: IS3 family transposase [Betaproteobacteria bacterium]|nr:IS3 family transposase [Betaproteobacteria bacterium]
MRAKAGTPRLLARADDDAFLAHIRLIHEHSRGTNWAPRIHFELHEQGIRVGRKRVARLMRLAGLQGVSRHKLVCTTRLHNLNARAAPDLVQHHFSADGPGRWWVADIT